MIESSLIQNILEDFTFLDNRLGDHPIVGATFYWREKDDLRLLASTIPTVNPDTKISLKQKPMGLTSYITKNRKYCVSSYRHSDFVIRESVKSMLAVPIPNGDQIVGVLSLYSRVEKRFEEIHVGRAQLLGAILGYSVIHLGGISKIPTPLSRSLGEALKRVRIELGFTQKYLAEIIGTSRIAVSRWEAGAQLPSKGLLYRWCDGLSLFSKKERALVTLIDISPHLIHLLKENPEKLSELSPSQFENLVAERLDRMGFDVRLTGVTSLRDGGIDLIALPKERGLGTFLLAGQVKHHRTGRKTGRGDVDRLLAWKSSAFSLGLLVTNTAFSKDALWVAARDTNKSFLRLRDFEDLKRWLQGKFWSSQEWREIPDEVSLAPGISIRVPKGLLNDSLEIWPMESFDPFNDLNKS